MTTHPNPKGTTMTTSLPGEFLPETYAHVRRAIHETMLGVLDYADDGLDFDAVIEQAAQVLADEVWRLTEPERPGLGLATTGLLMGELAARGPFAAPTYSVVGPGSTVAEVDAQVSGLALSTLLELADLLVPVKVARHPGANAPATYAAVGIALLTRALEA